MARLKGYNVTIGEVLHARLTIVAAREKMNPGQFTERHLERIVSRAELDWEEQKYGAAVRDAHNRRQVAPTRTEFFGPTGKPRT